MKQQLIQYVELLFAGAADCEDIKQEILQNTIDRYDDLIAEGKSPEAAYRLAIIGIGDINEILGAAQPAPKTAVPAAAARKEADTPLKKLLRAVAVGLYILCPIPVIVMSGFLGMDLLGLCGTLAIVAVATVLILLGAKKEENKDAEEQRGTPKSELHKSIDNLIWTIGLVVYFVLSFATGAWYITWVIFPLIGAVQGLVKAILDVKEASSHEN